MIRFAMIYDLYLVAVYTVCIKKQRESHNSVKGIICYLIRNMGLLFHVVLEHFIRIIIKSNLKGKFAF